jgi:hypothetical protein
MISIATLGILAILLHKKKSDSPGGWSLPRPREDLSNTGGSNGLAAFENAIHDRNGGKVRYYRGIKNYN